MSRNVLRMKYHPAKKEVSFKRIQNGKECDIRNDSRLMSYMKMKGEFVLQNYGNAFFDDIAAAFDGEKSVKIEVITTKLDFDDFVQMAEFYNEEPVECKIFPELYKELPDMVETYELVKEFGEKAIDTLKYHKNKLFEIPFDNEDEKKNEDVKKSVDSFSNDIHKEIENLEDKIKNLSDNNVNLCFAGVYSAGKSALINALLGYRILPESIDSKTAKMCCIRSPKINEKIKISFEIGDEHSELEWNGAENCFEFSEGPSENDIRTQIQQKINEVRSKKQHEQVYDIINKLNGYNNNEISLRINIFFPVPLDSENVQYTIFDTPGSDSDYQYHQDVLKDALISQMQSILIFVIAPNKCEGTGNQALLNYLNNAENNNNKTSIDLGRSLFVVNYSDNTEKQERENFRYNIIKVKEKVNENDEIKIKLSDKKLFFTSARYAYAAKAIANDIATQKETSYFKIGKSLFCNDESEQSYCYEQNHCATSELATNNMLKDCEKALRKARESKNEAEELSICSGIYALEKEIQQFGVKYASAVKTFAIIDSVNKVLNKLTKSVDSLKEASQQNIDDIQKNIDELKNTINSAIDKEYSKREIPPGSPFPPEVLTKLGLDKKYLNSNVIGTIKTNVDNKLKGWFFGWGSVKFDPNHKNEIKKIIRNTLDLYTSMFVSRRKKILIEESRSFIDEIKKAIKENGNISEKAKALFMDIPSPEIGSPNIPDIAAIYNDHRIERRFLFITREYIDKDGVLKDLEVALSSMITKMSDDYSSEYRNALGQVLYKIKSEFDQNLVKYSLNMNALMNNKKAMEKLMGKLTETADDLEKCQDDLFKIIWSDD